MVDFLEKHNRYVSVLQVINQTDKSEGAFIRNCLKVLCKKEVLKEKGAKLYEQYLLVEHNKGKVNAIIDDVYATQSVPQAVKDHFDKYGFEELVASVAKQIDHEGNLVKEYNIDRLWLTRYIDFLELAKEYTSFREADYHMAINKAKEARKQLKTNKNKT